MSYLLGIDLGTTYTAAAVQRLRCTHPAGCRPPCAGEAGAEPEMVGLGSHGSEMPSVVLAGEDGSLLVGEAAERRAMVEPDRVAREFKRRIGDPTPVSLGTGALPAQELTAVLVRHVVDVAAAREGGLPERITITHPASWGSHKLEMLRTAVDAALSGYGVPPVTLFAEPQAAAVCYAAAERVEPGSTIAVYDLGGGTFDAAVVRKEAAGGFTLLGRPEGLEFLGGVDFDEVVFEHVRAGAPDAFAGLDEADPAVWVAVARLRRECREAKEALSADTEVAVPVWLGGAQSVVRLHRGEFEELIGARVGETVEALRRAVGSAGLGPADLTTVLLVGGSSRIPLVAQTVSEQLGRPVAVDADPKNAIAKGAVTAMVGRTESSWPARSAPPLAASPGPLPWEAGPRVPGNGAEPPAQPSAHAGEPPTGLVAPEPATDYITPAGGAPTTAWTQDPPTEELPAVDGGARLDTTTLAPAAGPDRARSAAVLIGIGGVVAAVAVVGALVFWPNDQTVSNATPALPALPTASSVAPPPSDASAPTREQERQTRERSSERPPEPGAPPRPQVPNGPPPERPSTPQPPTPSSSSVPPPTPTTTVPLPPPPPPP